MRRFCRSLPGAEQAIGGESVFRSPLSFVCLIVFAVGCVWPVPCIAGVLPEIAAIIEKKRNRTLRRGTLFAAAFGLTGSPERKSGLSYYLLGIKGSLTIRAATGFSRMTTAIGVPGSA